MATTSGVVIVILVAVTAARGTRLHAVDSSSPWSGGGGDVEEAVKTLPDDARQEDRSWKMPQAAMSVLKECLSTTSLSETGSCVKARALRALDRLSRAQREIHLGVGMALVPDKKPAARSLDQEAAPAAPAAPTPPADEAVGRRLLSLLQGYSLRLELPSARTIRAVMESPILPDNATSLPAFTGRRRNGGLGQLLFFGSSLLPIKMSLLALLVGKALMLSTLAFAIPALRLLQQGGGLGGAGGGGGHCH